MTGTPTRQLLLRRDLKANIPTLGIGEPFFCTDTNELFIGTSSGNQKASNVYTPATPSNWTGPAPTTVSAAIDRLAAAVAGLLGGPV